jgi:hypothetical protein
VEAVRGFLLLAWKLRFVCHRALAELFSRLEAISRQAAHWQQWFEEEPGDGMIRKNEEESNGRQPPLCHGSVSELHLRSSQLTTKGAYHTIKASYPRPVGPLK